MGVINRYGAPGILADAVIVRVHKDVKPADVAAADVIQGEVEVPPEELCAVFREGNGEGPASAPRFRSGFGVIVQHLGADLLIRNIGT